MVEIKNLTKTFYTKNGVVEAIKSLSLTIEQGEFIALVGPSGCGKTTFLKILAGLIEPSSGTVGVSNEKVADCADFGFVFQSLELFPWLTVRQNIAFGLDIKGVSKERVDLAVANYLETMELVQFANFYPKDLSGGMRQRLAIARALINNPRVLLMDEPFRSLDPQARLQMQMWLLEVCAKNKQTVIFVTHDVAEAVFLADRIIVLEKRPMEIKTIYEVPFAKPRVKSLTQTVEFFDLVNQVTKDLEN